MKFIIKDEVIKLITEAGEQRFVNEFFSSLKLKGKVYKQGGNVKYVTFESDEDIIDLNFHKVPKHVEEELEDLFNNIEELTDDDIEVYDFSLDDHSLS